MQNKPKLEKNISGQSLKAALIMVEGDVQGVSYRYFAKNEASRLGLEGWAQNEDDGTVTLFVQGGVNSISQIIEWAKTGSPMATVKNIIVTEKNPVTDIRGFEVK